MATIRDLERVLGSELPERAEERRKRLADAFSVPMMSPEAMRWQADEEAAPVATRDAVFEMLDEIRAEADRGRWMLRLTVVSVVLAAVASIAAVVSIALYVAS
jgi:hypothetical protein